MCLASFQLPTVSLLLGLLSVKELGHFSRSFKQDHESLFMVLNPLLLRMVVSYLVSHVYGCFAYMYVCVPYACSNCGDQKRADETMRLEF